MLNSLIIDESCIYSLSIDKDGLVRGAGLTKGSEGITIDGENIKAGKFPVLFYGNDYTTRKLKKFKAINRNNKLLKKVSKLNSNVRDSMNTISGLRSVSTLGNSSSE